MSLYSVLHPSIPPNDLTADDGGGGGVIPGVGDPVDAPAGDSGIYYNTDNGQLWAWNNATTAWDLVLA